MLSIDLAEGWELLVRALVPITAGALVAAITAVVKNAFERRDARKQAERRLALASARTDFASSWYETSIKVHLDEADLAIVHDRTKRELESAYLEAQDALERGKSTIEEDRGSEFVRSLRRLLAIGPYENRGSYIVSFTMYAWLAVIVGAMAASYSEDETLDATTVIVTAVFLLFVFRVFAQVIITKLENGPWTNPNEVVVATESEFDETIASFISRGFSRREQTGDHQIMLSRYHYGRGLIHGLLALPSLFLLGVPNGIYLAVSLTRSERVDVQLRTADPNSPTTWGLPAPLGAAIDADDRTEPELTGR